MEAHRRPDTHEVCGSGCTCLQPWRLGCAATRKQQAAGRAADCPYQSEAEDQQLSHWWPVTAICSHEAAFYRPNCFQMGSRPGVTLRSWSAG